jgi:hypothetical protein
MAQLFLEESGADEARRCTEVGQPVRWRRATERASTLKWPVYEQWRRKLTEFARDI